MMIKFSKWHMSISFHLYIYKYILYIFRICSETSHCDWCALLCHNCEKPWTDKGSIYGYASWINRRPASIQCSFVFFFTKIFINPQLEHTKNGEHWTFIINRVVYSFLLCVCVFFSFSLLRIYQVLIVDRRLGQLISAKIKWAYRTQSNWKEPIFYVPQFNSIGWEMMLSHFRLFVFYCLPFTTNRDRWRTFE